MRKEIYFVFGIVFLIGFLFSLQFASADACNLNAVMMNQDPYPAIPGEEVKIVFQLTGTGNPACGTVNFEVVEKFPFSLSPGQTNIINVQGGQAKDFSSYLIAPYKIKVAKDAKDGDNTISVKYASSQGTRIEAFTTKDFNVSVRDLRTNFEVSIKDYVSNTKTLTFEILNTGENDVEALTIEIPKQENIQVKGSSRNIVGNLDNNEDTTFSFEAVPKNGKIDLIILYTDGINERRQLEKSVVFDYDYFTDRARDKNGSKTGWYASIVILIIILVWYFWRKKKKREAHRKKHELHHSG